MRERQRESLLKGGERLEEGGGERRRGEGRLEKANTVYVNMEVSRPARGWATEEIRGEGGEEGGGGGRRDGGGGEVVCREVRDTALA